MKTSKFFFFALLLAGVVLTSCTKDETPEPEKPTKTIYLLKNVTTVNAAWGTFIDKYTYNDNMQLLQKISSWGESIDTLDYQYDSKNRVSVIKKNNEDYMSYEYLDGVILEETFSYGNYTIQYNLNSAGKVIRSQDISGDTHYTYEWTEGNNTRKTTFVNNVVTETMIMEYNTTVKDLANEMYTGTLLPMTSTNLISKNTEGNVTYIKNAGGYPTQAVTPTIFGDFTQTFTYETKVIVVE
ncbi:MAG: hypothetical protein Q7J34_10655 [Bacteroidales bacterium]|nr:hypothetical protein [Bacteroidales bacterium]